MVSIADVLACSARYTLILGDSLDPVTGLASLPNKSVQHVFSDPPYSAHVHAKSVRGSSARRKISAPRALGFDFLTRIRLGLTARQFARVATRWVHVFSDIESCHLWREALDGQGDLEFIRSSGWHKLASTPQFTGDRPAHAFEVITGCHPRGRKSWNGGGKHGWYHVPILQDRPGERRVHSTQKPLDLMRQLLADYVIPGELVVDAFGGSMTTGVAALEIGARFIGWEADPEKHAAAVLRLAGADYKPRCDQPTFFDAPAKRANP